MLVARWVAAALFVACIPLFLVLTNVRIAANWEAPYGYAFSQYNVPEVTGLARSELDRSAREIIGYFQSADHNALIDIRVDDGGEQRPLFNQREVLHMRDVKHLFHLANRVHEFAFVYIVGYIAAVYLWSRERSIRRLAQQAMFGGAATVLLLGLIAVSVTFAFDSLWTRFHLVSFDNDFWLLNPATDRLIQMFPLGFWFDAVIGLGVVSMLQGGLVALAGIGYMMWSDRRRQRRQRMRRRASPRGAAVETHEA